MDEEDIRKEAEELDKELNYGEEKKKSPIWYILAPVLILLMILWIIPGYSVKLDPEPSNIPSLAEVVPSDISVEHNSSNDYLSLVKPNDPVVKQVADIIVSTSCNSYSKVCYAKAIFYFVRDNFQYVNDPLAYEYVKSPRESFVTGTGDCDDAAVAISAMMQAVGIPTRFVFVPRHVYVEVKIDDALKKYKNEDGWITVDGTCKSCGFGEMSYTYSKAEKRYLE